MTTRSNSWNLHSYIIGGLLAAIIIFSFPESTSKTSANVLPAAPIKAVVKNPFANMQLKARAAYVYDNTTGKVLYAKNPDATMPVASLTKVMTAITALEMASSTGPIVITPEALQTEGDTGLLAGEQWNLQDLLTFSLVISSNDGAAAIASSMGMSKADFIKKMNEKSKSLKLKGTWFLNESGLDVSTDMAGGYGTARDVATFMKYALDRYPTVMQATTQAMVTTTSLDGFIHPARNTNVLSTTTTSFLAGKTGYSLLAGGNLSMIFRNKQGHIITAVILGSTYDGRFNDMQKLINKAL